MNHERRCKFENPEGAQCRRYANKGTNFCYHHQPSVRWHETGEHLHPLARLATREDLFDVIRETLNATRHGRIAPGQAYAVGYLAQIWLQVYEKIGYDYRNDELYNQVIPTLVNAESAQTGEVAARPMPLPVYTEGANGDPSVYAESANGHRSVAGANGDSKQLRIDEKAAMEQLRAQAPPPIHTPEQRAELDAQLAEIKARSDAALAADEASRAVLPPALSGVEGSEARNPSPLSPSLPASPRTTRAQLRAAAAQKIIRAASEILARRAAKAGGSP